MDIKRASTLISGGVLAVGILGLAVINLKDVFFSQSNKKLQQAQTILEENRLLAEERRELAEKNEESEKKLAELQTKMKQQVDLVKRMTRRQRVMQANERFEREKTNYTPAYQPVRQLEWQPALFAGDPMQAWRNLMQSRIPAAAVPAIASPSPKSSPAAEPKPKVQAQAEVQPPQPSSSPSPSADWEELLEKIKKLDAQLNEILKARKDEALQMDPAKAQELEQKLIHVMSDLREAKDQYEKAGNAPVILLPGTVPAEAPSPPAPAALVLPPAPPKPSEKPSLQVIDASALKNALQESSPSPAAVKTAPPSPLVSPRPKLPQPLTIPSIPPLRVSSRKELKMPEVELPVSRPSVSSERIKKATYYYNMGVAYAQGGLYEEAAEMFEKALQINPDDASSHYNLGIIYDEFLFKLEKAILHYKAFIARSNDSEKKKIVEDWIKLIRMENPSLHGSNLKSAEKAVDHFLFAAPD